MTKNHQILHIISKNYVFPCWIRARACSGRKPTDWVPSVAHVEPCITTKSLNGWFSHFLSPWNIIKSPYCVVLFLNVISKDPPKAGLLPRVNSTSFSLGCSSTNKWVGGAEGPHISTYGGCYHDRLCPLISLPARLHAQGVTTSHSLAPFLLNPKKYLINPMKSHEKS